MRSNALAEAVAGAGRAGLALADRLPRWVHGLLAVGWASFLWQLSARPGTGGRKTLSMTWLWNSAHVVAYFGLGALIFFALRQRVAGEAGAPLAGGPSARRRGLVAVAAGAAYGVLDEWHQSYVPGRACSLWDMGSDVFGACLAVAILLWCERRVGLWWSFAVGGVALLTVTGATRDAWN